MRILQSGIYDRFLSDQSKAKSQIDDLTTQMSSGKKIDNSYDDSNIYSQTLRLDSEISSYKDIQNRTEKSKVLADASDTALNGMNDSLRNIKTKLILAANTTLNEDNLKSIATELKNERDTLVRLANSSVNGQYLFSGTAVNVKPIDEDGIYHGNAESLQTQVGKGVNVDYSIDGESLFFGFDNSVQKSVQSNISLKSQNPDDNGAVLTVDNSIEDLMGSSDKAYFYLTGVKHDGESFKSKIDLNSDEKVSTLLEKIENAYGNGEVKASLNSDGIITIVDQKKGNSKIDFQLTASNENVTKLSSLNTKLEFNKTNETLAKAGVDDSAYFTKENHTLTSNNPLLFGDGKADATTKLSEISNSSLDNKSFEMKITDVDGNDKTISLDLSDNSTFSIDGAIFNIYNAVEDELTGDAVPTKADDFTLSQLNSIISIAMSNKTPTSNSKESIDEAAKEAKEVVEVSLDSDGALKIEDLSENDKDIKFSLYDKDADDFTKGSSLSFNSNHAVVASESKINFFKDLDEIINSVENAILTPGSDDKNLKNMSIESAISKVEVLSNHINRAHVKVGAITNNLQNENAKAATMELNVTEFKSKISDVDIAETIMKYEQVSLNYQAMMSTISKVNSLSLLNYIK
jgi:flagellar hook-associated protein 3 FlgL